MSSETGEAGEQSFLSHLIELRSRLLRAISALLLVFLALIPFAQKLYAYLARPLIERLPEGGHMIAIEVASPFVTPLKLVFFVALALSMPVILYQLWAFVAPGLFKHERRLAVPILVSSVVLFYVGIAFAFFLVLPAAFKAITAWMPENVSMMTDITHYLDFVLITFLAFGVCFEVPVAIVILVALGWVTPVQLADSRRYAILGAFVISALIAPPDAFSMVMLAVPMCALYELGLLAARSLVRSRAAESAKAG